MKKTNFIIFSILKDKNNFDRLKIHNCENDRCSEMIFVIEFIEYIMYQIPWINNLKKNR